MTRNEFGSALWAEKVHFNFVRIGTPTVFSPLSVIEMSANCVNTEEVVMNYNEEQEFN